MNRVSRKAVLGALPASLLPLVRQILEHADRLGFSVHLVGGPVRDYLLGVPVRDVDLLVETRDGSGAPALAREANPTGGRLVAHERFGTARIDVPQGSVDLATARSERYAHPGALPRVSPGSLEDDLRRRDFTVNALAIPLSARASRGRDPVIDLAGGLEDLSRRRLRILHPRSFHDDPTRALRAARLAPRLGFHLTRDTRAGLRAALRDGAFGGVSGERLRREIEKLFQDACLGLDPASSLRALCEWHVLAALEPGLALDPDARLPLRRLGAALQDPPWPMPQLRPWAPGLALWLAPLAAALRRRSLRRFAVEGAPARLVAEFPRQRERLTRALGRARGRGDIDRILGALDEERLLALFVSLPSAPRRRVLRYAREDRPRTPPLTGTDLVGLGLAGPEIGRTLTRLRAAYLDGLAQTREEALALAEEIARRRRPSRRIS